MPPLTPAPRCQTARGRTYVATGRRPLAPTRVVTANVLSTLPGAAAARCLDAALEVDPDLVGLQEWRIQRLRLLARHGPVALAGTPLTLPGTGSSYTWVAAGVGDCVLGLRAERYAVRRTRLHRLGGPRCADPGTRTPPVLPPRWATVVEATDLVDDVRLGVVVFHLVPGAQGAGAYRADRPRTVAQHRAEVAALQRVVADLERRCDTVWAMGDSNLHGLSLDGLVSAWEGRPGGAGTLGPTRRIDDVFATSPAGRVLLVPTESDHRMVVVDHGPPAPTAP